MEYKLIKKFLPELKYFKNYRADDSIELAVRASDLEAELAKGVEVFGLYERAPRAFSLGRCSGDTHSGLLIGYKPLQSSKSVSREEIQELLKNEQTHPCLELNSVRLLKRILENGVK